MIGASAHRVPEILTLKNAASVPEAARRGPGDRAMPISILPARRTLSVEGEHYD
jgi:hypothetical protein